MNWLASQIDQWHAEGESTTNRILLKWSHGELGVTMQAYLGCLGLSWNNVKAKKLISERHNQKAPHQA
jgi:hypothetical protein